VTCHLRRLDLKRADFGGCKPAPWPKRPYARQ
jgi:hypothetical protein